MSAGEMASMSGPDTHGHVMSLRGGVTGGVHVPLRDIPSLGPRTIESPLTSSSASLNAHMAAQHGRDYFVGDGDLVRVDVVQICQQGEERSSGDKVRKSAEDVPLSFPDPAGLVGNAETQMPFQSCADAVADDSLIMRAGPRRHIYFDPQATRAAIVSCGGLCPGTNDVIRALVMALWYRYGVREIEGFRFGFEGLNPESSTAIKLTPDVVKDIARFGGTMLGSSRGPQEPEVMVEFLKSHNIDILFAIGGDGTLRGVHELCMEVKRRNLQISIIGIPKTIDNDISFTQRTFGFETAVERAQLAVTSAHAEARSQRNCVGLVKVMGRESGFVALFAALASPDVNLLLIPEVPFTTEKILSYIERRLRSREHCVVLVAEGAGQDLMEKEAAYDKSGNRKLGDIGTYLRDAITADLKKKQIDGTVKYIDPSYMIRSAPAIAGDSIFCQNLGHMAVHAGMAGYTGMVVGLVNGQFVHLPVDRVVECNKRVDPSDLMYQLALDSTGTPRELT